MHINGRTKYMTKLQDISEESIKLLVDKFYEKVRADAELGKVFTDAIGHSASEWKPHLEKMYDFWSSLMLTSGRYHGNPLKKHMDLPKFDLSLFGRWLELFTQTAEEIYHPEIAQIYISKSERVAANLKFHLHNSRPSDFTFAPA